MSTEDPAWKAELWSQIEDRFPFVRNVVTRDAIWEFVTEHIQAAEERGRREALREAAEDLRDAIGRQDYEGENERSKSFVAGWRLAADHIDPDKEKA